MALPLGEHGALERTEFRGDLGRQLAGGRIGEEAVLKHEAGLKLALDDGEPLGGAKMGVRAVHATWIEKTDSGGDALAKEDREVILIGYKDRAYCLMSQSRQAKGELCQRPAKLSSDG